MSQVTDFFKTVLQPYQKRYIEEFKRYVPHAKIVEIRNGHHLCFINQEEIVFYEMMKIMLEN